MNFGCLRRVSVCLSGILDCMDCIGSEDVVSFRRKNNEITNYAFRRYCIYSGSMGEGYNFSTSDKDLMVVCNRVFESTQDIAMIDGSCETKLLMRRENCNAGFVILQLLNHTHDQAILNSVVIYDEIRVVSSLLHRDFHCSNITFCDVKGHGPCSSGIIGNSEYDFAICFECKLWPTEAYDFIHRTRHYQWPAKQLLDGIVERGCHLVAIGDKDSDISHIQWRLSFSVAEKVLMHSLNHTQFKVYGLLKIFLKEVIDKEESVKGVLCSYFMKTALFYSIESTPASFWRDDLIILNFWFCFNKLFNWVIQGYCPNYFVPRNNMFRNKIYGETQQSIARVLCKYKGIGWTCLYQCEDLKILQNVVENPKLKVPNHFHPNGIRLAYTLSNTLYDLFKDTEKIVLRGFFTLISRVQSRQVQDICAFHLTQVLQNMESNFYSEKYNDVHSVSNKKLYSMAKKSEIILLKCSDADISRGLLCLATSYYRTGQYNKALCACKTMVSRWKPFVIYLCNYDTESVVERFWSTHDKILGQQINDIVSKVIALPVYISLSSKHMYPPELKHDLKGVSKTNPFLEIPPLPYAVFLLFLCHHKLGNIDDSLSALHDLKTLVNDKTQGRNHIVYNMLAICSEKLGDTRAAIDACIQSIQIEPKRNGAFGLIDKILSVG